MKKFLLIGALIITSSLSFASEKNIIKNIDDNQIQNISSAEDFDPYETKEERLKRIQNKNKINEVHNKIFNEISKIIDHQYTKGYFTETAKITLEIIPSFPEFEKYEESKRDENKLFFSAEQQLTNNVFTRPNKECSINLTFDTDGKSPFSGEDLEVKILTKLKNEEQKTIMRQYVALHEHSHCEFSGIENPITLKNSDKQINDALKGIKTLSEKSVLSYVDTLNENFADAYALSMLIKQYGIKNQNLLYVIEVLKTQRNDVFIEEEMDVHLTHNTLNDVMQDNNIKKIIEINNPEELKKFVLEIANKGTMKTFSEKEKMVQNAFSEEAFNSSIISEIIRIAEKNDKVNNGLKESLWKLGNSNIVTNIAENIYDKISEKIKALSPIERKEIINKEFNIRKLEFNKEYLIYKESTSEIIKSMPQSEHKENYSEEKIIDDLKSLRKDFLQKTEKLSINERISQINLKMRSTNENNSANTLKR